MRVRPIFALLTLAGCSGHAVKVADEAFSDSYHAARARFLSACGNAGAFVESTRHPKRGPRGGDLYTDVALLGPRHAKKVLVISSGTHGVEGFAGSGLQTLLLRRGLDRRLPGDTRLVLIHALNPYGFAWDRRFNEDNVDLNRNFVDHEKPYPPNPGYEKLADAIAPREYTKEAALRAKRRLLAHAKEHGERATQAVITRGQFTHPKGIHFGGHGETWSSRTLRKILERHVAGASRVVMLDLHTGLGKFGEVEIILNDPEGSPAVRRAKAWWGGMVKSTRAGGSVSAHLVGTLKLAVPEILSGAEVTAVSVEFGTSPPMEVFFAMQAENWLHNHGRPGDPRAGAIKANLRRVFYPNGAEWKKTIWDHTDRIVGLALEGLM